MGGEIMKENIKYRIFGICLTAFLSLASAVFVYLLATTKFLTAVLVVVGAIALAGVCAGVFFLANDSRKKLRTIIASVISLLIFVVQIFGSYYLLVGKTTLEKITTPEVEKAEVGVYVRIDDNAKSLEDAKNYTFGILDVQDREITDSALSKISKILGKSVNTKSYGSVEELMNALLNEKEIYAVILNKSFIELFAEIEGHTDDAEKIREIYSLFIETEKIVAAPKTDLSVFTVYISGIDCFGSITRRSRSDVNIIATVNTETGQVLLVSTPRDVYVPLSTSNGIPDIQYETIAGTPPMTQ
jgi:anionic cell wall polymer biosynthesis LytR-Cps2A-Psr (LCP) family protein